MFKVNNKNTRTTSMTINFKRISLFVSTVFIVDFEQVNSSWVICGYATQVLAGCWEYASLFKTLTKKLIF